MPTMAEDQRAIVMQSVGRQVKGRGGDRIQLLADVNFSLNVGQRLHLVGPSGAGKSTLVRLINRLDEPTVGAVHVMGQRITDWPVRELRKQVGMVFQEPSLVGLDVGGNLRLPFELTGQVPEDIESRMQGALELAGLEMDLLDRRADQLSVGQKQRVTLARALIAEPRILVLDEPTSSLDPQTACGLLDRVAEAAERRDLTLIMVTHRLSEAKRLGGHLGVLMAGQLRALGQVSTVLGDSGDREVAQFLAGANDEHG